MVIIRNPSIFLRIRKIFNSHTGEEILPDTADYIQPVIEVNKPIVRRFEQLSAGVSGDTAIFTCDSNKDTYITGVYFSVTTDNAIPTGTVFSVRASAVEGTPNDYIIAQYIITGTPIINSVFLDFGNAPIKIVRGSLVYSSGTYAAGTAYRTATVFFYEDEVTTG